MEAVTNRCRPPTPAVLLLTAVLATSILTACGGSGDSASNPTESSQVTSTRLTPDGTTLKIGEPGIVRYAGAGPKGGMVKSRIAVIPKKLESGSIDDLEDALEPSEQDSTPYYVEVEVKNVGSGDLSGIDPTVGNLTGVDERDESLTSVTFIGDFDPCNEADAPQSLGKGESFDTCLVFLVPKGGGSLVKVQWSAGQVLWKP